MFGQTLTRPWTTGDIAAAIVPAREASGQWRAPGSYPRDRDSLRRGSAQTFCVAAREKPVPTPHQMRGRLFPDHALAEHRLAASEMSASRHSRLGRASNQARTRPLCPESRPVTASQRNDAMGQKLTWPPSRFCLRCFAAARKHLCRAVANQERSCASVQSWSARWYSGRRVF
jgi:hypothetical protein